MTKGMRSVDSNFAVNLGESTLCLIHREVTSRELNRSLEG